MERVMLPGGGTTMGLVSVIQEVAVMVGSAVDETVILIGLFAGMLVGAL